MDSSRKGIEGLFQNKEEKDSSSKRKRRIFLVKER